MSEILRELAPEFRDALTNLSDTWFPRVIDRSFGGYLCDFDYKWRPREPNAKMLEFQARTLRFVARAARIHPELESSAECGFQFLRDTMWDPSEGGFFRIVDREGRPLEQRVKHGHGTAYAISALSWYYRLTGDDKARELAQHAFEWLDLHAHDPDDGGYFSYYRSDGSLILSPGDVPTGDAQTPPAHDPLGNPLGYKDANTTVDLLEALADLYKILPSPKLRSRLEEMYAIVTERVVTEPGVVHFAFTRDWKPIPHLASYGQSLQAAHLIVGASRALTGGDPEAGAVAAARRTVDHMLNVAWDPANEGFYYAGWAFGRTAILDCPVFVPDKSWWPQAEGLKALLMLAVAFPDDEYDRWARRLWSYIDARVIDHRHGGWRRKASDSPQYNKKDAKASLWKDPCHEGFALLMGVEICTAQTDPPH